MLSTVNNSKYNLTNKKFGKLKVLHLYDITKRYQKRWLCICDCGRETKAYQANLVRGLSNSCGKCNRQGKAKKYKDIYYEFIYRIKKNARTRGYEFNVSMEYLWELFIKQDRKCVISGLPIAMGSERNDFGTASLDRIDNNLGYIEGNVQWLHTDINRMKWAHGQQYFMKLCKAVADYNKEQQ